MKHRKLAVFSALMAVVGACSGDSGAGAARGGSAGNNFENPSNSVPSRSLNGSDNPAGAIANATPGMTSAGAAGAASMTMIPNTSAPVSIDETGANNPAGLAAADVQKLLAGGPPADLKLVYPYEGTVFPRGLLAPTLMWLGGTADAVYIHIKAQTFEYKSIQKPVVDMNTMQPQLPLPQAVWDSAGQHTHGQSDVYTLELSTLASGTVRGPVTLHFNIAQATVKGSIYYNSYASQLPGAAVGGNVLRIPAGGKAEVFLSFDCNGCHTVSANGSVMLSQINLVSGGQSFQLVSGGAANPMGTAASARVSFAALYPDGSKYLATSVGSSLAHAELAEVPGTSSDAQLYDTPTGMPVADTGIPTTAMMPNFSPDGLHLAFTDNAVDSAHGIAVMDYDTSANKATNYKVLTREDASSNLRPGWPFFLPDGKALVFVRTDSPDFSGLGAFVGAGSLASIAGPFASLASAPVMGPQSELYIADLASGTVTVLARAMGYNTPADAASGNTYLPFGADDLHQSYFPTVAPIAAGGYFWVFFDSIRNYGNLGMQRQIWGAAIDIQPDGKYVADPSHPPFYLPGQEFGAGNHRAFAALDPCHKDGDSCTSGIDCCGGFCSLPPATELVTPVGTCTPKQNTCAQRDERCTSDADCCPPADGQRPDTCIAGFCAQIVVN